MTVRTPSPAQARIHSIVEPVIVSAGYDLEQVAVSQAGRRSLVRVIVDKDGGVSLDDIAEVSRQISAALDRTDTTAGADGFDGVLGKLPYTLEVTSPGVNRPLTEPRHWRRAVGRLVIVPVGAAGEQPARQVKGRVLAADDTGVRLDVDGEEHALPYGELGAGRVQVEFGRKEGA